MFADKLISLRKSKAGLSQAVLADALGVTQQAVGRWEKGLNMPDLVMLQKIADYFHVTTDALLGREAPRKKGVRIPVLGSIVAGIPIEAIEEILGWEEIPESMAGEYFALRVKGHSMEPKYLEGDTVIVRKESTVDSGRVAIVLVNGDEATMKQVMISPEGITLIGYNALVYEPHFYNNNDVQTLPVRIIGEVVELRRKI